MSEKDIAERLRDAYTRTGGNSVGDPFVSQIAREIAAVASAIEARRAETGTGSVHESAARAAGTPIPSARLCAALSAYDSAPRYGVEEIARAIMVAADCGLTVEGERVLCDHRLASCRAEDCGCRRSARAVLSLLASGVPEDDRARIRNEALEEAAMIFDELAEIETTAAVRLEEDDEADDAGYHHDNARHAAASAVRIRSLKTKDV